METFGLRNFKEVQFSNIREKISKIKGMRSDKSSVIMNNTSKLSSKSSQQLNSTPIREFTDGGRFFGSTNQKSSLGLLKTKEKLGSKEASKEHGMSMSINNTPRSTNSNQIVRPKTAALHGHSDANKSRDINLRKAIFDRKNTASQLIVFDNVSNFVSENEPIETRARKTSIYIFLIFMTYAFVVEN